MKIFTLFFLLFLATGYAFSQDSLETAPAPVIQYDTNSVVVPLAFDKEKIETYKKDPKFDYSEEEDADNWWQRFKRWVFNIWNSFWEWLIGDLQPGGFWYAVIAMLPYLLIAGIIAFLVWLFYRLNPGARLMGSQKTPEIFFTEEEAIIRSKDIQKLIKKALKNKEYRLAIRYYYLLILKKLTEAEMIEYEFDKTNTDYLKEISSERIAVQFKKATLLYDYIWYGSFAVTEADYLKAERTFTTLEQQIPAAVE